jgi:glycerophosphoryl diester phosphodiesterase
VSYGARFTPLAIAHRGGMALAPENSLAAFARSVALGVYHLETDLVTTRDGALLCHHDTTVLAARGQWPSPSPTPVGTS